MIIFFKFTPKHPRELLYCVLPNNDVTNYYFNSIIFGVTDLWRDGIADAGINSVAMSCRGHKAVRVS